MADPNAGHPLLLRMLASMEKWRASDLFVGEGRTPAARVHGAIVPLPLPSTETAEMDALLDALLTPALRARFDEAGDLDVGYSLGDGRRFRFNLSRQRGARGFVARALPPGEVLLDDLGLPPSVAALADLPRGLVLVTGATGSGKSTTLAALVHRINTTRAAHVVTIEDPIELVHADLKSRITQREVGPDTTSFAAALRHVVRQSPDVIVIGELRDLDTIAVALAAALTGHLVLASLHTIDATQTLQRLLAYFPEHMRQQAAMDLSLSLQGVVSQRLLPRADGKGRALAVEVLTMTPGAARLVREQRVEELLDLMRTSNDPGIVTFNRSLLGLFQRGVISHEMGRAYATNPDEFNLSTQGMETGVNAFLSAGVGDPSAGVDMKALLRLVMVRGASDLHLAVGRPPILRVSGTLEPISSTALSAGDVRLLLYSILNARQRSAYELERELDFALQLDDGRRFRVNAYYQKGQMAAALRAIPSEVPSHEELALPPVVLELGARSQGLLLVVGPTGSGKTTTLACLVDRINQTRSCRIMTVEDPIEYIHRGAMATIDQREVYADTRSFAAALKYVLRQDPDVILVGEMRDTETISAALTAAETGHLVLATLHTNDAVQAVDRIIDVFPPHQQAQVRSQLAACILGVVSQRLLPRADGQGRTPAFEVMVGTVAIRAQIRDNKMHQAHATLESGRADGMVTMDHSLRLLVERGVVTTHEALRHARSPKHFTDMLGHRG